MNPILAVTTVASTTLVLTGCDSPQDKQSALHSQGEAK